MKKILLSALFVGGILFTSCDTKKETKTDAAVSAETNSTVKEDETKANDIQEKLDKANAELNQLLKEI